MPAPCYQIHPLAPAHYAAWCDLYRGYAEFYHQPMDDTILQQVWQWLTSGKLHGIVITDEHNTPAGFAHWELILRPLRGMPLAYLHDLFVEQNKRGSGYGKLLLAHVGGEAKKHGCSNMRWLTKSDNTTARVLYDKTATAATEWVLYQQLLDADG